ncbi:MAG TPA: purine-nucleoside phosphorylase [Planctomycetes bacterium]|nr:purine-nucleoside phosphorylase [Planctomycetota bacterium]
MRNRQGDWNVEGEVELLRSAVRDLKGRGFVPAQVGIVLGSGLKDFAQCLEEPLRVPFFEIDGFPSPRVPGHGGDLLQGTVGGVRVHCLSGRVHLYEGYHVWEVVRAVRTLALLGTPVFLLTNAAGGIREDLLPGNLMLLIDHLNLTARSPLMGPNHALLGPRFPAMSEVYCPLARKILRASDPGEGLKEGVYAQVMGPSYETPAEIRMLRTLGGDAVGMSTVPEAVALHAMGKRVCALSVITNRAAGLSSHAPNHKEVVEEGKRAAARLHELTRRALPDLASLANLKPQ